MFHCYYGKNCPTKRKLALEGCPHLKRHTGRGRQWEEIGPGVDKNDVVLAEIELCGKRTRYYGTATDDDHDDVLAAVILF